MDGDTASKIALDVGMGINPEDSTRVKYGKEELKFRAELEEEWKNHQANHPDDILDIPE